MSHIKGSKVLKNINRKKILENILKNKEISRANISKNTGLNKATVSEQISALINEHLIIERESTEINVGRKPILVSLNAKAGYSIGIDFDASKLKILVTDLSGHIVIDEHVNFTESSFEYIFNLICTQINQVLEQLPESIYGVIGIGIGIHSLVDNDSMIIYDPNFKWEKIDLSSKLEETLNIPTYINNNNNLSAYAEKAFFTDTTNLICISLSSGIGSGIFIDNEIYKGYQGFSGEIGHMIVMPHGKACPCGNQGCWEQYVSEKAILNLIAERKGITTCTLKNLEVLLKEKDACTLDVLETVIDYLHIGLNNVINMFNPDVIVINSKLLSLYPEVIEQLQAKLVSSINYYNSLALSTLKGDACALGGAALSINTFLNVSNINLSNNGI